MHFRIVETTGVSLFSFSVTQEGVFLFLVPFELALIWPWTTL
jgi:hypothetical protein